MSEKEGGHGHTILTWWPVIGAVILGAIAYGSLQADVSNLKERIKFLEERPAGLAQLPQITTDRVTKGDLCRDLFIALTESGQKDKLDRIGKELGKLDCYEGVAAMQINADPTQRDRVNAVLQQPQPQPPNAKPSGQ